MKALIPSAILTLILSAVVGAWGTGNAFLRIDSLEVANHYFFWSWPFFVLTMALFSVIAMQVSKETQA
jgi:hypothetical protein